ncbi:putative WD repeat-containing protein [Nymphaea thermarum]|nr:putative WD repeat-containing protein [Nymphaea thermarum]
MVTNWHLAFGFWKAICQFERPDTFEITTRQEKHSSTADIADCSSGEVCMETSIRESSQSNTKINMSSSRANAAYLSSSTLTSHGAVFSLAASATAVFAGTTAFLHFPNTGDLSVFETHSLSSDVGAIKSIVLSDAKIFTSHQDGKIRVWEQKWRQHLRQVAAIPTMTEQMLLSLSASNFVQVRRDHTTLWINHFDVISAIAISGGLLYSTSWDRTLKVWSLSDFRCLESVRAHDDAINALAVSADGTVYTGSADASIKVWTRSTGANSQHSLVATLEMHRSGVNALALSSDGSVLYSGSSDQSVLVWEKEGDAGGMAVTSTLRGHRQAVLCVANALELLASGSADKTIRIWRRGINNQYSTVAVLEGHERPVKSLAIAPSECTSGSVLIYSGSLDGEIKAWRVTQP